MKRIFITLITFVSIALAATAQINFGLKAGTNFATIPTNVDAAKSGHTGWFVGPTFKAIIPLIGLGAEANLLYSNTGATIENETYNKNSIEIPMYLRYELSLPAINKIFEPFIAVGPQWGWTVGKKEFGINPNEINDLNDIKDFASEKGKYFKFNESCWSLNFGLGFILFNHLQVHANYNLALGETSQYTDYKNINIKDLDTKELIEGVKSSTNIWQISLAYIF